MSQWSESTSTQVNPLPVTVGVLGVELSPILAITSRRRSLFALGDTDAVFGLLDAEALPAVRLLKIIAILVC